MGRYEEQRTIVGHPVVISEREFAQTHAEFWHQLLPMAESYVRARNRHLGRFIKPIKALTAANVRGLVNEIGFRLFAASVATGVAVLRLPVATVLLCIDDALVYVLGAQHRTAFPHLDVTSHEVIEAQNIGERLGVFFEKAGQRSIATFPQFLGCGRVDECVGDVLAGDVIFEIKAGERNFRAIDLRQVLVYCALNFAAKSYSIERICLINPRMGVFLEESLDDLCDELAGRPPSDILADIVEFISDSVEADIG
jgi:hypothetical protein